MAAYHFSAKIHSRGKGASGVRAAAYRAGARLRDERLGKTEDYTRKSDVIATEILTPEGAPSWCSDRETLWNAVEARERRKDSQVAHEFEINLPRELSDEENWNLITAFARRHLVSDQRICDIAFHGSEAGDGESHPHAHILMPVRVLDGDQLGAKHPMVDWRTFYGKQNRLAELRRDWCEFARARAAELGIDLGADWDHRSYQDRGIDIEAQPKIGAAAQRIADEGGAAERVEEALATARRNGERLREDPALALQALTRQQSTFTERELARWIHRNSADDQFQEIFEAAKTCAVPIGSDDRGQVRFSTHEMIETERRMLETAGHLAGRHAHLLRRGIDESALENSNLFEDQKVAAARLLADGDLSCLIGHAGAGKSTMLAHVREQLEGQGFIVRGAALSGIAAENLEKGSGIAARTLASWDYAWENGREQLGARDVLVIDEAGMIGSRQMAAMLDHAERAGAKVILIGDAEQLQSIEAGAAFRAIAERAGSAELTEVRRQAAGWQRDATKELATGQTVRALERYEAAGCIHGVADDDTALAATADAWNLARQKAPEKSRLMLAHTRADVNDLNQAARERLRQDHVLVDEIVFQTSRGERAFAVGDRLLFLRNDRAMGVKNGMIGTVTDIGKGILTVRTDDGRPVNVDAGAYQDFDYGYAVTIHKAQGVTVDQSFVLAGESYDRHLTYVACSRHRDELQVFYSDESFGSPASFNGTLSRERTKDVTADYLEEFAAARQLKTAMRSRSQRVAEAVAAERENRLRNTEPQPITTLRR